MREPEPGDVVDERFEIVDLLARSGMASVYKAKDRARGGLTVALKVPFFHLESDPGFFSRFEREEKIGRAAGHPSDDGRDLSAPSSHGQHRCGRHAIASRSILVTPIQLPRETCEGNFVVEVEDAGRPHRRVLAGAVPDDSVGTEPQA